jgi:hypothetical protein
MLLVVAAPRQADLLLASYQQQGCCWLMRCRGRVLAHRGGSTAPD